MKLLATSASLGFIPAHSRLGDALMMGRGEKPSPGEAVEYYKIACGSHIASACFSLAYLTERGEGLPNPDSHMAKRYYDLALMIANGGGGVGTPPSKFFFFFFLRARALARSSHYPPQFHPLLFIVNHHHH